MLFERTPPSQKASSIYCLDCSIIKSRKITVHLQKPVFSDIEPQLPQAKAKCSPVFPQAGAVERTQTPLREFCSFAFGVHLFTKTQTSPGYHANHRQGRKGFSWEVDTALQGVWEEISFHLFWDGFNWQCLCWLMFCIPVP